MTGDRQTRTDRNREESEENGRKRKIHRENITEKHQEKKKDVEEVTCVARDS